MKEVKAVFLGNIKRTSEIVSFRFKIGEVLEFIPGQFAQLIFDEGDRTNKELNKYLSFSASPLKPYIEFTKRISDSAFSQRLMNLKPSDEVLIKGPMGNYFFKEEQKKIGFLIGGIGITPAISIIEYIVDKKLDIDVQLLYSNRTEADIAFKDQLNDWAKDYSNIEVIYAITDCKPQDKLCIHGFIDKGVVLDRVRDQKERVFYMVGPPAMVSVMKNLCSEIGCQKEKIKTENFAGY